MNKFSNFILLTFAYLGFLIGAGVATGQEILQYYTPNGFLMFGTGAVIAAILIVANFLYIYASKHMPDSCDNPYVYFFGKKAGNAIDIFCMIFCYLSFIIMISGGATSLNQEYGIAKELSIIIVSIIVLLTVVLGLKKFVKIIGFITPVIITVILVVSIVNIIQNWGNFGENFSQIENNSLDLVKAGNNWFLAGISNGGFCLLMLAKFSANLGRQNNRKHVNAASIASSIILIVVNIIIGFSLLLRITEVFNVQIPNLYIFNSISSVIGQVFGIFIFLALYTSACPLLWSSVVKFSKEKTTRFYIGSVVLAVVAVIVAMFTDFNVLINNIYTYFGYIGFAVFVAMIISFIIQQNFLQQKK